MLRNGKALSILCCLALGAMAGGACTTEQDSRAAAARARRPAAPAPTPAPVVPTSAPAPTEPATPPPTNAAPSNPESFGPLPQGTFEDSYRGTVAVTVTANNNPPRTNTTPILVAVGRRDGGRTAFALRTDVGVTCLFEATRNGGAATFAGGQSCADQNSGVTLNLTRGTASLAGNGLRVELDAQIVMTRNVTGTGTWHAVVNGTRI